jgi:hypothetical protein
MLIANPIYDTAFKRLMENQSIAKFFIGTLINQNVVSLTVKPQEYTHKRSALKKPRKNPDTPPKNVEYEYAGLSVFRVDFVAVIKTADGELKKILVEVQKSWDKDDLMRFRQYLGDQYKRSDIVDGEKKILPITTIYVLDFNLPEIKSPCIKVERNYIDLTDNNTPLKCKRSPFIESLTHDSYVVQAQRIKNVRLSSNLAALLSVFEQNNFVENKKCFKNYLYNTTDASVQQMIDTLHFVITDDEERKELEDEQEYLRTMDAVFGKMGAEIAQKDEELAQKEKELAQEKGKNAQKEKELAEEKKKNAQKDDALAQKDEVLAQNANALAQQIAENERIKKLLAKYQK